MAFQQVSSRVNFPELEERVQQFWKEQDIFAKSVQQREGAPQKRVLPKVPAATAKKGVAAFEEPEQVLVETDPRRQCKLLWSGFQPYGAKVPPPDFTSTSIKTLP